MSKLQSNNILVELVAIHIPNAQEESIGNTFSKTYRLIRMKDGRGDWLELLLGPEPLLDWQSLQHYLCVRGHPPVSDNNYWKNLKDELIQPIAQEFHLCSKLGYHDDVYVDSRGSVLGKGSSIYKLDPGLNLSDIHERSSGTLDDWKLNVAAYAKHSDLMMFCICASLSGALIHFTDMESGGFHLHIRTSKGKSTIFFVAGSVCGDGSFVRKWYTTDAAIEEEAFKHNDNVLLLDDIKLLEESTNSPAGAATVVQDLIYLLSSGVGKVRFGRFQAKALTWRIVYLSNGEKSLATLAREGNKPRMGGSEVRCFDVPCDRNSQWGVFDSLPEDFSDSGALAEHIERNAKEYFGTAKPAFVERLLMWEKTQPGSVRKRIDHHMEIFMRKCGIDRSDGPSRRIAKRFALTYAAGAIAAELKVLDFSKKHIGEAVLGLYKASIDEMPLSQEALLEKAHKRVLKRFARHRLIDLTANDVGLTDADVKSARGFVTSFRDCEVFAVTRCQFESQVGDKGLASELINRYLAQGVLMSGGKDGITFQPPGGVGGKRLPRCLCFFPDKLK